MDKDSLFAAYFRELAGEETIFVDYGFVLFREEADHIYIKDIYVVPDKRHTKLGLELLAAVENIARKIGKPKIVGSVVPSYKDSNKRVAGMLKIGFKVLEAQDDIIFFIKEI